MWLSLSGDLRALTSVQVYGGYYKENTGLLINIEWYT